MAALVAFAAQAQDRADRQELTDPDSFTMILLGDPQGYTKYDINQPLFDLCTAWIADNVDHLNIKPCSCTAIWSNRTENIVLIRKCSTRSSREMWEAASHALARARRQGPLHRLAGQPRLRIPQGRKQPHVFPRLLPLRTQSGVARRLRRDVSQPQRRHLAGKRRLRLRRSGMGRPARRHHGVPAPRRSARLGGRR